MFQSSLNPVDVMKPASWAHVLVILLLSTSWGTLALARESFVESEFDYRSSARSKISKGHWEPGTSASPIGKGPSIFEEPGVRKRALAPPKPTAVGQSCSPGINDEDSRVEASEQVFVQFGGNGGGSIQCPNGNTSLPGEQYQAYKAIKTCYGKALHPEGTGAGWAGNILHQPKCTDVEKEVRKQVNACTEAYYKQQGTSVGNQRIVPCSVFDIGLVLQHVYMGICRVEGIQRRLIVWTDPWDGRGGFYCPGTGRNNSSHQVH